MDMNVKGSVFIPWVRAIKANKTGVYDKYLTDKDREIINERILPNIWYPYETYKNLINATFEVVANKDLEVVAEWTRLFSQQAMTGLYAGSLEGLTPLQYIKRSGIIIRTYFSFGKVEGVAEAENQALLTLSEFDMQFLPIQYIVKGWLEGNLSLCGAKNIKSDIVTKSWEGAPHTAIRYTWT